MAPYCPIEPPYSPYTAPYGSIQPPYGPIQPLYDPYTAPYASIQPHMALYGLYPVSPQTFEQRRYQQYTCYTVFFISIEMCQIADVLIRKTRRLSLLQQGLFRCLRGL